ncbi:MAG: DUF4178 domain-containing protein [Acidobacteriia bacterium]|nr:DUF4178 domain-containing protein [Terriglobia bacterium]
MGAPAKPAVKTLDCPSCGGVIELRGLGQTLRAVCVNCLSIIDTTSPELRIIQKFEAKQRIIPLIPLGTRGKLDGDPFEAIGFQARQILVDGTAYQWREYVLFNPFKGFRYLSEYDGHWNNIQTLQAIPADASFGGKRAVKYENETYRHFQSANASTVYVMGEFPWMVMVGEEVFAEDFIAPPRMLSSEKSFGEITWSRGEYMTPEQVREAFALKQALPSPRGVFANQPSPHKALVGSSWITAVVLMALLAALMTLCSLAMGQRQVLKEHYSFTPGSGEASFVTPVFALDGRTSNLELSTYTNLDNNWAYLSFALINEQTGQALDFGRELSYYHGRDSDGSWTEGSNSDSVLIPSVPPGRYYLRVEPEMQTAPGFSQRPTAMAAMRYEITLRRDVPWNLPFVLGFVVLLIPPLLRTFRAWSFESTRWKESDYAPSSSDGDDDDDD